MIKNYKNQMKEILKREIENNIEDYNYDNNDYDNLLNSLEIKDYIEREINEDKIEKYISMILIEIQELNFLLDDKEELEIYRFDYNFESIEDLKSFIKYLDNKYYED